MAGTHAPTFFDSQAEFRRWLEAHHAKIDCLWVGFWKAKSGKSGLTCEQAVEEALCFGWIDGLVKRFDGRGSSSRRSRPVIAGSRASG